ncbi:hypothetical protein Lfu02_01700 [Longispora fulva]|nr:hypothetical protein Lfu02_01700 [Longispora fulva]
MAMWWMVAVTLAASCVVLVVAVRRRARRKPATVQEKMDAARRAALSIRKSKVRPHRDTFERGDGVGEMYSAAILENSIYGDAASGSFD